MSLKIKEVMTVSSGLLVQGVLWLAFWLGPAFHLFEGDPRWGHNYALALIFLTVGLASKFRKISCELVAVFASFLTVPTFLALFSGINATYIALTFLIINVILYLIERGKSTELVNPRPRLKAWLKIHQLNFAYIGLAHMPLIFFAIRWFNPNPFLNYLPIEHEISTSTFNFMLLILTPLALMERYVKNIGSFQVSKIGFVWAILMIIVPLLSIGILGQ